MKQKIIELVFLLLFIISVIECNQSSADVEETTTELCSNGTEDSCEALVSPEDLTVSPIEETTNELPKPPATTRKPKTTTAKHVVKKPISARHSNSTMKPNPECSCDTSLGECEVNCCCDVECSAEQRAVFTQCLRNEQVVNPDHCFPQTLLHSNNTDYQTVETEPGVLCVLHHNTLSTTDYADAPILRTVAALEKKLGEQKHFFWPNQTPPPPVFDTDTSYNTDSPVWVTDNITISHLKFPASMGHTSVCQTYFTPKYLEEVDTSCTNQIRSKLDCINSGETRYTVISSPRVFNFTQPQECTEDVCLPIQQYICSTTCLEAVVPHPTYNDSTKTCHNVIESTEIKIYHNGSQGVVEVKAFYRLKNISAGNNQLYRKFNKVSYFWAGSTDVEVLKRSGRPGYQVGKPIISGRQTGKRVEYNTSASDWISISTSGHSGLCLKRKNLLFGENLRSQCLITVNGTCKQMQEQILRQVLGPAANWSETIISSYGDPRTSDREAWVPILSSDLPPSPALTTAVNILVVHSLVGHATLPQSKVVAVFLNFLPPTETCSSNQTKVAVETSVKFIDKTTPAVTKFAQPPVYEIKLPRDFFYPFLSSASSAAFGKLAVISVLLSLTKNGLCGKFIFPCDM